MATTNEEIGLQGIGMKLLQVRIEGTAPLLQNKPTQQTLESLLDRLEGKARGGSAEPISREEEWTSRLHKLDDGRYSHPAIAFKLAMVEYAKSKTMKGITGAKIQRGLRVIGDTPNQVLLQCSEPHIDIRFGNLGGRSGSGHPIIRPMYDNWAAVLRIRYDSQSLTADQIVNLLNRAGENIGIGAFSPQKSGDFGTFRVKERESDAD